MAQSTHSIKRIAYQAKFGTRHEKDSRDQDTLTKTLKGRNRAFIQDYSIVDSDGFVFMDGKDFAEIFGDRHANTGYKNKLAIVKIFNPNTGKSIHRQYRTCSSLKGWKDYAALTYHSLIELVDSQDQFENMEELEISKGSVYKYYWNHPFHATKVATRLGVYGIVVGVISIIVSVFSSII